jgi:hypothetical protein
MKTELKNRLASEVDPLFFGVACLLLLFVLFTAKLLADGVLFETDRAYQYFSLPFPRL